MPPSAQLTVQSVQERQRLLGLKEAAHLGPLATRQQGQRHGDLLLGPGTVIQVTIGTKYRQGIMGHLPAGFEALRAGTDAGPIQQSRQDDTAGDLIRGIKCRTEIETGDIS